MVPTKIVRYETEYLGIMCEQRVWFNGQESWALVSDCGTWAYKRCPNVDERAKYAEFCMDYWTK